MAVKKKGAEAGVLLPSIKNTQAKHVTAVQRERARQRRASRERSIFTVQFFQNCGSFAFA